MTVEYVDAGEAVDQGKLSGKVAGGEVAPPVVAGVNYERIEPCAAHVAPQRWFLAHSSQRSAIYRAPSIAAQLDYGPVAPWPTHDLHVASRRDGAARSTYGCPTALTGQL